MLSQKSKPETIGETHGADGRTCRACGNMSLDVWKGPLLDLTVRYMRCPHCEYLQTEYPHWLGRAYASSINASDTGIMARNLTNAGVVLSTLLALGSLNKRIVDFAGGYGILTRLLRDRGVDALWADQYTDNLVARGFEYAGEPAVLVTAFEAFEHFVEPAAELDRMLAIAPNVLLSTELLPDPVPSPGQWWYYGAEHGQHIGFYTMKSLRVLAASRRRHLVSDGRSYHLITERKLSGPAWRGCLRFRAVAGFLARRTLISKTAQDHARFA